MQNEHCKMQNAKVGGTIYPEFRRPRRWFVQISLRTFFVLLTIGCITLAVISKRARDQRMAVDRVLALRGFVMYDYEEAAQRASIAKPIPPGWPWLRRAIGQEYFQTVVSVKLDNTKVTDEDLLLIGKLPRLHTLSLNFTQVSDEGLAHVRNCRQLNYLGLAETKVTGEGLVHVAGMTELEDLILQYAPVDDRGIEHLRGLRHLTYVNLGNTRVTSKCVDPLATMPMLEGVNLAGTAVDDAAVPQLLAMKNLREVSLGGTRLSGAALLQLEDARPRLEVQGDKVDVGGVRIGYEQGAQYVQHLLNRLQNLNDERHLKMLDLSGTQITDRELSGLHGLNNLEMLDLRDTLVTDEGVAALSAALPNCQIRR